jgi:predicted RND superfamily exporter protein
VRDRIERLFAAWGRFAYRRAWLVIGLVLLLVGSLASQLPRFSFDTSTEGFFLYMLASMNDPFYFGLLTGFTIIAAFLADLILAPARMAPVIRPRGVEVAAALEMEASR